MRHLHTEIRIAASRERVWSLLTDFDDYPRWNPFMREVRGTARLGERIAVVLKPPGGKTMRRRARITALEPQRELRWLGRAGVPGIFDGEHRFLVETAGDRAVRLVHEERFSGLAVPLLWKQLDRSTRRGFEQMNVALKQLAEQGERTAAAP